MNQEKHAVRISRDWHNPTIKIDITNESIGVSMALSDFLTAVATEIGNPIAIATRAQLAKKLTAAVLTVTESMKRETTAVV